MMLENPLSAYDSLAWMAEMGVDLCVENTPQTVKAEASSAAGLRYSPLEGESKRSFSVSVGGNAFEESPHQNAQERFGSPSRGELQSLATRPALNTPPPTSITASIAEARALADGATDLASLEAAIHAFNGCGLKKTATTTVFAQGVATSGLMFIGDAPGADEDRQGIPFCGESGQLLDKMLGFIGLTRSEHFYISNCLFWRPPGNRQPNKEEIEICLPLVEKHIALAAPKRLVLVGGTAASAILGDTRGITRLRGQIFSYKNDYMADAVPVHVIYHPSYLLRQPLAKKQVWGDLLALKAALAN